MPRIKTVTYNHQYFHSTGHQLDLTKLQCRGKIEKTIGATARLTTFKSETKSEIKLGFNIPNGVMGSLFDKTIIVIYRKTYSINVSDKEVTAKLYHSLCNIHQDERFYFYHYDATYDLAIFKEANWSAIAMKTQKINQIANSKTAPRFQFQFLAFDNLDPAPIHRIIEFAGELMIKSCHSNNLGTLVSYTKKVSD